MGTLFGKALIGRFDDSTFYGFLYVLFAAPILLFLSFQQPVLHTPDEASHFARAYQVTNGLWFPTKHEVSAGKYDIGGMIDREAISFCKFSTSISNDKELRLNEQKLSMIKGYRWSEDVYISTKNVSIYPPFLYLPQALGISIGKTLDMSIASTTTLSRIVNATLAMLISLSSLLIARRGVIILFVILMLPMTLAQFASTSQDALCISLSALCAALFTRIDDTEKTNVSWPAIMALSCLIILISTSRPPYLGFAATFLAVSLIKWKIPEFRNRLLAGFSLTVFVVISWTLYVALFVSIQFGSKGVSYGEQLKGVLGSPFSWFGILFHTWVKQWWFIASSFIGNLGYLDTPMAFSYYCFAGFTLFTVFITSTIYNGAKYTISISGLYKALLFSVLFITTCGVYLTLYVSWTPVGVPVILGVQGRYLIPIALFISLLGRTSLMATEKGSDELTAGTVIGLLQKVLLLMFCVVTSLAISWTVAVRYY